MDTDPVSRHRTEEFLTAEEEHIPGKLGSQHMHVERNTTKIKVQNPEGNSTDPTANQYDMYRLDISLAVVETECD